MNFQGMIDKRNIFLLLGCYCNNPRLVLDEAYGTKVDDYSETFHKMLFGAIFNIAKKGNVIKITPMDIENELSLFTSSIDLWNVNNGFDYVDNAIQETEDKIHNVGFYRDVVRKYSILRNAYVVLKMDISFIYEEYNELETSDKRLQEKRAKMEAFNRMDSKQVLGVINERYTSFKNMWQDGYADNFGFHLGDGVKNRLEEHRNQENVYGYPFQSAYLTTIFRGMRPKKFIIRSSKSGGGKSRSSMADCCNISSSYIYDWSKKKWVFTGEKQPSLFISTELSKEEIQDCLLAHISGIEEDRIVKWEDITEEENKILEESAKLVEESLLYGEYMPDFTIDSIVEKIEYHILNNGIKYAFFDYINDSPSLYGYYIEKTGVRLQTHQILFLFSSALKQVANKYNIFLGSSTQLSANWKDEKDANALKGAKSIAEKTDGGMLALPITSKDIKKLKPILDNGFYSTPNFAYYIFKNRGGRWNSIIVWTQINLGTVREKDCFVTNNDFELITDIEKTLLDFELDDVGDVQLMNCDSVEEAKEYLDELQKTKL